MIDRRFGELVRRHQQELGLSDKEYGAAVANEMRKYDATIPPVARGTVLRWRTGHPPDALYATLLGDLMRVHPNDLGIRTGRARSLREDQIRNAIIRAGGHPRGRRLQEPAPGQLLPIGAPASIDWERLGATMRSVSRVDARIIDDQWTLSRHYIADLGHVSTRTHLDLIGSHIARLRQLRGMTTDDRLRHELGMMTGQMTVCAGFLFTGLMDYGLAMESYRYCVELAEDMRDAALRTAGLVLQAQLYGGQIQRRLPMARSRVAALLEAAESDAGRVRFAPAQAHLHATGAPLHALLDDQAGASRAVELAHRAVTKVQPGLDFHFANHTGSEYLIGHEAGVAVIAGRPADAAALYASAIDRIDTNARHTLLWFHWSLAAAHVRAGEPTPAIAAIRKAESLERELNVPFFFHGLETVREQLLALGSRDAAVRELAEDRSNDN